MCSSDLLFYRPQHPYNKALQKSIPALQAKGNDLYTIPGLPPDLSRSAEGCPFAPRCEFAEEVCRTEPMRLQQVMDGHASACVRVQKGELKL